MNTLTKIDRALAKVEEVLLALLLIGLVVLAAVQVLLRNVWSTSIDWADLTLQNATVLIGLLGAAVATSEGRHLNIDVFGRALKGRHAFVLRVVIGVFAVYICGLLTIGGWQTFQANYVPWKTNLPEGWGMLRMLKQELSEGSFPQWLSQILLPTGFAVIGVHFVLRLLRDAGSLLTGKPWEGDESKDLQGDAYLDQMMTYADGEQTAPDEQTTPAPAQDDEDDTSTKAKESDEDDTSTKAKESDEDDTSTKARESDEDDTSTKGSERDRGGAK